MRRALRGVPLLGAWLTACAVNPATGERQISLVSESQEIAMGREYDPQAAAFFGIYPDSALQAFVSDMGQRMAATSERPDLPWTFRLADDPAVNAFAIPGGFIYVTRGLMASLNSEAELAGVVGHEIGHVTARHSANQMSRQQLQQIGLVAGMVLSEQVRQYGGMLQQGLAVLNLSYSRSDESQADALGVRYMTRSGYDARELIGVMETLALSSGDPRERVPEWQQTHPYPENRRADLQARLAEAGTDYADAIVDREGYLERLDGLVYGLNPREGYFDGARFHHPDLAFRIDVPSGWRGVNQKTVAGAVAPGQDALVALSLAADASSPREALNAFVRQEGVDSRNVGNTRYQGLDGAEAEFAAQTEGGAIQGWVYYVAHDGRVYQVLGYAARSAWSGYASVVREALRSFAPETDPAVLGVQPARLDVVRVPRAMTFQEFLREYPSSVSDDEVARINRRSLDDRIESRTFLKRVVGGVGS